TIEPQIDRRWRSGLDALLVFSNSWSGRLMCPLLGLFSAVITSFLVDSLTGQQDEAPRTNELLTNLIEILFHLSDGANFSTLKVSAPELFQPDPLDLLVLVHLAHP
ncbi:hypothetical protein FB451DRAFT_1036859, partial [Mycena latifolia]